MCGLTGIVNRTGEPVEVDVLRQMTDAVAHRGPDGEGYHVDEAAGLGHRRLAIIDLDEHSSGKANRRLLIWSLLSFEWWCRCFLSGSASNPAPADSLELATK